MNDTGAYLCGSLLGRHKLFPRVSPGKSWEGSIGGGLLVVGIAILVWYLLNTYVPEQANLNMWQWAGLCLTVVVFGTWGDLVESLLKRTLGIKDSGNILPGHGGMLDRFDSSLLAIPAAVVYLFTISLM
jgi:phosphatidate cytidylyltransferase